MADPTCSPSSSSSPSPSPSPSRLTCVGSNGYLALSCDFDVVETDAQAEAWVARLFPPEVAHQGDAPVNADVDGQHHHHHDRIVLVGLDAEWPPCDGRRHRRARGVPVATVAQVAWRDAGGGSGACVMDLTRLSHGPIASLLDRVIFCPSIVKVGYGIRSDVEAIAQAAAAAEKKACEAKRGGKDRAVPMPLDGDGEGVVGDEDGDEGSRSPLGLGKRLNGLSLNGPDWVDLRVAHGVCINPRGSAMGLTDLVSVLLGCPLDKAMQCSAWGARPLGDAQLRYAALDAACLLDLFDKAWVRLVRNKSGARARKTATQRDTADAMAAAILAAIAERRLSKKTGTKASKGKHQQHQQHQHQHQEQQHPDDIGSAWVASGGKLPPKFVCDEMLEGLAKQLRSCGIDTAMAPAPPPAPAPAPSLDRKARRHHTRQLLYRRLVEVSEAEDRVILTSDEHLFRSRLSTRVFLVGKSLGKQRQLVEVVRGFRIEVDQARFFSRCTKCNGDFQRIDKTHRGVPARLADVHEAFWICKSCSKVYWEGSTFKSGCEHLAKSLSHLKM